MNDEYRSVPISGWPNRKDCPSDDGPAKVSQSIKPSTFENSPIHNAVLPTLKIYNNLRYNKENFIFEEKVKNRAML